MAGVKGRAGRKPTERVVKYFLSDILDEIDPDSGRKRIANICRQLIKEAETGDLNAIKEVFDRLEGKPVAPKEISGPDGGEIPVGIKVSWTK